MHWAIAVTLQAGVWMTFSEGRGEEASAADLFPRGERKVRLQRCFFQRGEGVESAAYPFPRGELHTFSKEELGKVQCNMSFASGC